VNEYTFNRDVYVISWILSAISLLLF